jgi:RNA polymerase sigma-70 factor (ECF subfamily)
MSQSSSPAVPDPPPLGNTAALIERVRAGDVDARERLFARYLPVLRRFAHGRLPAEARGLSETDDLVQMAMVRALNRVESFEPRHEGAFLAYLRHILVNIVREEIRRARRRPAGSDDSETLADGGPSPVEAAIGRDMLERYESALLELPEQPREAVMLRIEFGYSYPEVAEALGLNTSSAARMMVTRALIRVAERVGNAG